MILMSPLDGSTRTSLTTRLRRRTNNLLRQITSCGRRTASPGARYRISIERPIGTIVRSPSGHFTLDDTDCNAPIMHPMNDILDSSRDTTNPVTWSRFDQSQDNIHSPVTWSRFDQSQDSIHSPKDLHQPDTNFPSLNSHHEVPRSKNVNQLQDLTLKSHDGNISHDIVCRTDPSVESKDENHLNGTSTFIRQNHNTQNLRSYDHTYLTSSPIQVNEPKFSRRGVDYPHSHGHFRQPNHETLQARSALHRNEKYFTNDSMDYTKSLPHPNRYYFPPLPSSLRANSDSHFALKSVDCNNIPTLKTNDCNFKMNNPAHQSPATPTTSTSFTTTTNTTTDQFHMFNTDNIATATNDNNATNNTTTTTTIATTIASSVPHRYDSSYLDVRAQGMQTRRKLNYGYTSSDNHLDNGPPPYCQNLKSDMTWPTRRRDLRKPETSLLNANIDVNNNNSPPYDYKYKDDNAVGTSEIYSSLINGSEIKSKCVNTNYAVSPILVSDTKSSSELMTYPKDDNDEDRHYLLRRNDLLTGCQNTSATSKIFSNSINPSRSTTLIPSSSKSCHANYFVNSSSHGFDTVRTVESSAALGRPRTDRFLSEPISYADSLPRFPRRYRHESICDPSVPRIGLHGLGHDYWCSKWEQSMRRQRLRTYSLGDPSTIKYNMSNPTARYASLVRTNFVNTSPVVSLTKTAALSGGVQNKGDEAIIISTNPKENQFHTKQYELPLDNNIHTSRQLLSSSLDDSPKRELNHPLHTTHIKDNLFYNTDGNIDFSECKDDANVEMVLGIDRDKSSPNMNIYSQSDRNDFSVHIDTSDNNITQFSTSQTNNNNNNYNPSVKYCKVSPCITSFHNSNSSSAYSSGFGSLNGPDRWRHLSLNSILSGRDSDDDDSAKTSSVFSLETPPKLINYSNDVMHNFTVTTRGENDLGEEGIFQLLSQYKTRRNSEKSSHSRQRMSTLSTEQRCEKLKNEFLNRKEMTITPSLV